jgi:predicted Fe-Mo cluster-binding NifX family protein
MQKVKIAITIWGNRISPVFDSAHTLMIVQVENLTIINREFVDFDPRISSQIASILSAFQIDALICGAITELQSKIIEKTGIKLISFIAGNVEEVLMSLLKKPHRISEFLMPGGSPNTLNDCPY